MSESGAREVIYIQIAQHWLQIAEENCATLGSNFEDLKKKKMKCIFPSFSHVNESNLQENDLGSPNCVLSVGVCINIRKLYSRKRTQQDVNLTPSIGTSVK